jgi:hypothetical protein
MNNKGQVAGILSIISGAVGFIYALFIVAVIILVNISLNYDPADEETALMSIYLNIYLIFILAFFVIPSILSIIGGVFSLKRRMWVFSLAGMVAASIVCFPCGIAATILVSLGKSEFEKGLSQPLDS